MAVNRYVRLGLMSDMTRYGIFDDPAGGAQAVRREYLEGGKGGRLGVVPAVGSGRDGGDQKATRVRLVGAAAAPDIEPLLTAAEVGRVRAIPT